MTSTIERLRLLNKLRPLKGAARDIAPPKEKQPPAENSLPAGQEIVNAMGACYVTTHVFPMHMERGTLQLGAVLAHSPGMMAAFHSDFHLENIDSYSDAVFLDTETTGLGTGASVYAFMIGVGTFETIQHADPSAPPSDDETIRGEGDETQTQFVVRQYFMRNPAEELAVLDELASLLASKSLLVTFNGRSFDLPLLRARVRYNRPFLAEDVLDAPLLAPDAPHLDLLMPARRLWRRRLQSCRLAHLEEAILGHERSGSDVPGYLIPQMYTDFLQTGDAREMERVFYHNREDIVSMVSLATHLSTAYCHPSENRRSSVHSPMPAREEHLVGQDWLSLAITYEQLGEFEDAETAYLRAQDEVTGSDKAEVFRRLGLLLKRQGRWQNAADTWQLWLTSVPGQEPTPYIELSKYCEWQLKDYDQAEMWAAWALHNLTQEDTIAAWQRTVHEIEHRLERIRRKKARSADNNQ